MNISTSPAGTGGLTRAGCERLGPPPHTRRSPRGVEGLTGAALNPALEMQRTS